MRQDALKQTTVLAKAGAVKINPTSNSSRIGSAAIQRRNLLFFFLLCGPALLWFLVFMIGPLFSMFYLSLLDWGSLLAKYSFAGLENYVRLFSDPTFFTAVRNTAIQLAVDLPVMILSALMLGYFLNKRPRGHRLLSIIFFTPALMSASAIAMMFLGIYAPDGIVNTLLRVAGLPGLARLWLADESTALASIIAMDLWSGIGFTAVIFAARLSAIPREVFEAAAIDGASEWRRMWSIAFPIIRDFIGTTTMLQFIWILGSAQNVLLLTEGGPGNASKTLGFMLYNEAFVSSHLGYSQAVGVLLFIAGLLGMLLIRRAFPPSY